MSKSDLGNWLQELGARGFPEELPIIPLRNAVLLPGGTLSITAGRPKTLALLKELVPASTPVGIVTQKSADVEDPSLEDLHEIGTVARVVKVQRVNDDAFLIIVHGMVRFHMDELVQQEPFWRAKASQVVENEKETVETEALGQSLKEMVRQLIELVPDIPSSVAEKLDEVTDPGLLADLVGANLDLTTAQRLEVLETLEVPARLKTTLGFLSQAREMLDVRQKINAQVRSEFSKHQREAILRQQLKAIQEELGEKDPSDELEDIARRLSELDLPEDAARAAKREMDRLKRMSPQQADYHVARTYLEWILELPWNTSTEDHIDLDAVSNVLDEGHFGMKKVKRRILEYLAIKKLNPQKKGPILCLVGPPGVGKTSLGTAIATAIGRKLSGRRSAACGTRRRSAGIGGPTSGRCRAGSSPGSKKPAATIRSSCSTKSTRWACRCRAIRPPRCSRCSIRSRIRPSRITISRSTSTCRR